VLGLNRLEPVKGAADGRVGGAILELDNVAVGNQLDARTAGLDHWGSQRQGQERSQSQEMHDEAAVS